MTQNTYIIRARITIDVIAKDEAEAEELAMEQLPEGARIESTEYDGPYKPGC